MIFWLDADIVVGMVDGCGCNLLVTFVMMGDYSGEAETGQG
jgi:hypothetical protein